ncbi:helix-turn-helix domain-containing protein [Streptomyces sp. NPDC102402]|uniref:helix-turn-helix domain-containing protein n=1 Tax=Streptomyces sp. NPDC102402 TaxID=3366169 RepID=UPI00381A22D8
MATPSELVTRALEMAAAGSSDSEVAAAIGVSSRTVIRIRQRHGVPSTWQPETALCGSPGRYKAGCRCPVCCKAHGARLRTAKAARYARRSEGFTGFAHGASAYSNWGCRCPICTTAHGLKSARYKRDRSAARKGGNQ